MCVRGWGEEKCGVEDVCGAGVVVAPGHTGCAVWWESKRISIHLWMTLHKNLSFCISIDVSVLALKRRRLYLSSTSFSPPHLLVVITLPFIPHCLHDPKVWRIFRVITFLTIEIAVEKHFNSKLVRSSFRIIEANLWVPQRLIHVVLLYIYTWKLFAYAQDSALRWNVCVFLCFIVCVCVLGLPPMHIYIVSQERERNAKNGKYRVATGNCAQSVLIKIRTLFAHESLVWPSIATSVYKLGFTLRALQKTKKNPPLSNPEYRWVPFLVPHDDDSRLNKVLLAFCIF